MSTTSSDKNMILDSYVATLANGKLSAAKEAGTGTGTFANLTTKGYVTVSGTQYNFAGLIEAASGKTSNFSFTYTYNVYATKEGYCIGVDGAAGSTDLSDLYYVSEIFTKTGDYGTTAYYAQRVSLSDGKTDTVQLEEGAVQSLFGTTTPKFTTPSATIDTTKAGVYTFNDDKVAAGTYAEQKSNNGKLILYNINTSASDANDDFNYTIGLLTDKVASDDTSLKTAVYGTSSYTSTKYYLNSSTKYFSVESYGDDIDVSLATGGMKCSVPDHQKTAIASGTDYTNTTGAVYALCIYDPSATGSKTAASVIYISSDLNTSGSTASVVYITGTPSTKLSANTWQATAYFMDDPASSQSIQVDSKYAAGFYTYSKDSSGVYKLSDADDLTVTDKTYDDETGGVMNVIITGAYNKNGISTLTGYTADKSIAFNDVNCKSAVIADDRGDSGLKGDIYGVAITSIGDLKDAVETAATSTTASTTSIAPIVDGHATAYASMYLKDGVTFVYVYNVTALTGVAD